MELHLTGPRGEINFCAIKSYARGLPDSSASGVVIQCSGSMPPRNVSGGLRYIADHTLQFYRAPRFVEFVGSAGTMLVHDLHFWHWNTRRFDLLITLCSRIRAVLQRDLDTCVNCASHTRRFQSLRDCSWDKGLLETRRRINY